MEEAVSKSVKYTYVSEDASYVVQVAIVSDNNETQLEGIDYEKDRGFIYEVSIITKPELPTSIFEMKDNLIFILGNSGEHQFGFAKEHKFIVLDESRFIQTLVARMVETLMIIGNTGNFTS